MKRLALSRRAAAVCAVAIAMLGAGCAREAPRDTHDADVNTIREGEVDWVRHWSVRDTERIVAHYSEDAWLTLPQRPPAKGKEAIRDLIKEMVQDAALRVTFEPTSVEVARSGELGFTEGTYRLTLTDPATRQPVTSKGAYVTIYHKIYGSWRAARSVHTSWIAPGDGGSQPPAR